MACPLSTLDYYCWCLRKRRRLASDSNTNARPDANIYPESGSGVVAAGVTVITPSYWSVTDPVPPGPSSASTVWNGALKEALKFAIKVPPSPVTPAICQVAVDSIGIAASPFTFTKLKGDPLGGGGPGVQI